MTINPERTERMTSGERRKLAALVRRREKVAKRSFRL